MKFTIQTDALAKALRIASVATMSGRSTLPILGNIKIEAKGEQIILSTTNLDIYVTQKVDAKVKEEGATTAPFSILSQLAGKMEAKQILITEQKGVLEFKCDDDLAEIETLPAEDFPGPLARSGEEIECNATDITIPFQKVFHAISTEATRYVMQGINLSPEGEFTATDGRRIAMFLGIKLSNDNVTVPDVFIRAIAKIEPKGQVKVFVGGGAITLISDDIEICGKLIEGNFPTGPRTVMGEFQADKVLSCGRKGLIRSMRVCEIATNSRNPGLFISGNGKEVEVSEPGKALSSLLGTELSGQPEVKVRVNEQFMIAALETMEGEDVRIQLSKECRHILVEEGKFREIIMPMNVVQ